MWMHNFKISWSIILFCLDVTSFSLFLVSGWLIGSAAATHYAETLKSSRKNSARTWKRLRTDFSFWKSGTVWHAMRSVSWLLAIVLIQILFGIKEKQS